MEKNEENSKQNTKKSKFVILVRVLIFIQMIWIIKVFVLEWKLGKYTSDVGEMFIRNSLILIVLSLIIVIVLKKIKKKFISLIIVVAYFISVFVTPVYPAFIYDHEHIFDNSFERIVEVEYVLCFNCYGYQLNCIKNEILH